VLPTCPQRRIKCPPHTPLLRQAALLRRIVAVAGAREDGEDAACRLTVVGDVAQSIYKFQGADVGSFRRFVTDYPDAQSCTLATNYRSTRNIIRVCDAIINQHRGTAMAVEDGSRGTGGGGGGGGSRMSSAVVTPVRGGGGAVQRASSATRGDAESSATTLGSEASPQQARVSVHSAVTAAGSALTTGAAASGSAARAPLVTSVAAVASTATAGVATEGSGGVSGSGSVPRTASGLRRASSARAHHGTPLRSSLAVREDGEAVSVVQVQSEDVSMQFLLDRIELLVTTKGLRLSDIAVMARTNRMVLMIANVFKYMGVPYTRARSTAYG